jgi:sugar/nucleoside kinase (ribokinase family)
MPRRRWLTSTARLELDLVAVGEVLLDVTAPELSSGAVVHGPVRVRAGGVPVHAAVAAARAGARAAVVGRVGSDPAAAAIKDALARAGVEAQLVEDRERPSGTYVETRDAIAADRGASAALAPGDIPSPLVAGAVLVSGHALLHDDTVTAARLALTSARARHVAVVAASARMIDALGAAVFHERAAGATVVVANAEEARALTNLGPAAAVVELARRYRFACVTAGDAGAFAATGSEVVHVGVDPVAGHITGAGDALAGVLLVSLARGIALHQALAAGCEAASGG